MADKAAQTRKTQPESGDQSQQQPKRRRRYRLTRAEYLAQPTRGQYTSPTIRTQIIGLRKMGRSYREIAAALGVGKDAVLSTLATPEAQRELATASDVILRNLRQRALQLAGDAMESLESLIKAGDRYSVNKLLSGVQVYQAKSETVETSTDTVEYTREERTHYLMFGHLPGEQCGPQCREESLQPEGRGEIAQ